MHFPVHFLLYAGACSELQCACSACVLRELHARQACLMRQYTRAVQSFSKKNYPLTICVLCGLSSDIKIALTIMVKVLFVRAFWLIQK